MARYSYGPALPSGAFLGIGYRHALKKANIMALHSYCAIVSLRFIVMALHGYGPIQRRLYMVSACIAMAYIVTA